LLILRDIDRIAPQEFDGQGGIYAQLGAV